MVDVASNTLVDSTTSDTSALTKQPSVHTPSVMLPAPSRAPSPQPTPAGVGLRPTYATVAAAAPTPHPARREATPPRAVHLPARREAAPPRVVQLTLRREAAPPGAVHQPTHPSMAAVLQA